MAYTKNTWASGDVVTAEKLNHMESGIESAATAELPAVTSTDNGDVLTVVEGVWSKAVPSGGGVEYDLVLIEDNTTDPGTYTLSGMSYEEIVTAITQSSDVRRMKFVSQSDTTRYIYEAACVDYNDNGGIVLYRYLPFGDENENEPLEMSVEDDVIYITLFGVADFTATYDSATHEYTLTPLVDEG